MGEYCFYVFGEKEGKQTVIAEEFLEVLADDKCQEMRLIDCMIEGEVDISQAGIEHDTNHKYVINKMVDCRDCVFKNRVSFSSTTFSENANFSEANFSENANFSEAIFSRDANFRSANFSRDASFSGATFSENANFRSTTFSRDAYFISANFSRDAYFSGATFNGDVSFRSTTFSENAYFSEANFSRDAYFSSTTFSENANFSEANFSENANFSEANFSRDAYFISANFSRDAYFNKARFNIPADFASVSYNPDTLLQFRRQAPTQFYLDSQHIFEVSNPHFKRYVADQQFTRAFKQEHPALAGIWQWSSDYGRSIGLWAFWSVLSAFVFGLLYSNIPCPSFLEDNLLGKFLIWADPEIKISTSPQNWFSPFYFSIITFTTLGFGDVLPTNGAGQFWILLEVILGYVMLGGLISIFANKLARRS